MLAKPFPFLNVPLAGVRLGILALLKNRLNRQLYIPIKYFVIHCMKTTCLFGGSSRAKSHSRGAQGKWF